MKTIVRLTCVTVILSTYSLAEAYYDFYGNGIDSEFYQHPDYFRRNNPYNTGFLVNGYNSYRINRNHRNDLRYYNNINGRNSHSSDIKRYEDISTPNRKYVTNEKVQLNVFYEVLCPYCRKFETEQLVTIVKKLGKHLDIYTFPYGNAQTSGRNGRWVFSCQHGPAECFGNKLHACVIDSLQDTTKAIIFNACLMEDTQEGDGSDVLALNVCGSRFGVNVDQIKRCAIGRRGSQLMKYYGDETQKMGVDGVPYILINGVNSDGVDVWRDVCSAFKTPPEACKQAAQKMNHLLRT